MCKTYKQQYPTEDDTVACLKWLPYTPGEIEDPDVSIFMQTGYQTNVIRIAQSLGPILISKMVKAGLLKPEEDPVEILEDLIECFTSLLFLKNLNQKTWANHEQQRNSSRGNQVHYTP